MRDRRRFIQISRQSTTFLVAMSVMLVSWMVDAALDSSFEAGTFMEQLLWPAHHDIALRLWFGLTLLFFLFCVTGFKTRHRRQEVRIKAARHSAETERARWQAVLASVGDAISMQDLDLKVIYQNQAHIDLMGKHLGEYCYQAYQHQEQACEGCHLVQSFRDGRCHTATRCAETGQGLRIAEIISTPLRDSNGRIVAGIEAVRDVTDRARAEQEIERMARELELRARELAETNRELESFSYSLSHDLRSYITRISTAQQLLANSSLQSDADPKYPLQIIEKACEEMEELIDAILVLSNLSRERIGWEEVSLSDMAVEVILHLRQQELERQVEVVVTPDLTVRGDRNLLRIVLENLLGNAWKYTRSVPAARIEFGTGLREEGRYFYVRDNGIGFDMEESGRLFSPFQRLPNAKAQGFTGNGVGLATVKRAVKRLGGEVWGEGEPGRGATFCFQIPDREAPASAPSSS